MELEKINTFLHNHTGAKFFESDMKLFIEKFPDSKLIPSLKNAVEFQKSQLDERICAELLMHQDACIDCIWENRGFYINAEGFLKPLTEKEENAEFTEAEKQLLDFDLTDPDYNEMQKLIYALDLKVAKKGKKDYINALSFKKHELMLDIEQKQQKEFHGNEMPIITGMSENETDSTKEIPTEQPVAIVLDDEKKSEDHEGNIPQ